MYIHLYRVGGHRLGGGRNVGYAIRQATGRGQWTRRVADGVVGDAATRVPVPGSCADAADRRDVHQLVVGGAIGKRGDAGLLTLAGQGGRRRYLTRLPVGHGDAGGHRLQRERGHISDLHPVAQSIAVVCARVSGAARDRYPGWNGQAQ